MPIDRAQANLVLNQAIGVALAVEGIDEHLGAALRRLQEPNVIPSDEPVTDATLSVFDQAMAPIQEFRNSTSVDLMLALSLVRESASAVARGMLETIMLASQQGAAPPPYSVQQSQTSSMPQSPARPSSSLFFSSRGASAALAGAAGEALLPTYDEAAQGSQIAAAFAQPNAEAAEPTLSRERQRLLEELFDCVVDDLVEPSQAVVERDFSILLERIAFTDKLSGRRFGLDRHHADFRDGFDVAEPISPLQYAVAVKAIDGTQRTDTDMCRMILESLERAPNVRELLPRVREQIATENLPWQADDDIQVLIQAYVQYLDVYRERSGHPNPRQAMTEAWQAVGQAQRLLPMSYIKLFLGKEYPASFTDVRESVNVAWRGARTEGLGDQFSLARGKRGVPVGKYPPSTPNLDYNALVRLHAWKTDWLHQSFIEPLRQLATRLSVADDTAPPSYSPTA